MKKRLTALILLFALIFTAALSLSSCGEKYKPVESTSEEKRTVMKISYDGEKYEVPYELYRAFFLQLKSSVDGGKNEVWTGADKDKYIKKADELVYKRIADIYAVFHLCEKADINVYSKDFDKKIQNHIETSVEGGNVDGVAYEGFGGDYDKYLAALKEMNLNYSAQALLIRYQLAYEALAKHYMGSFANDELNSDATLGEIKYTKEDIKAFYNDESRSRRVILAFLQSDYFSKEKAEEKRAKIAACSDEKAVTNYIGSLNGVPSVEVIGKYTYDKFYYSELTDEVFSLEVGEATQVVTLKTDDFDGYVIAYRLDATSEFFDSNYSAIATSYLYSKFGETVENARIAIEEKITPTDTLKELDRSKVTMG